MNTSRANILIVDDTPANLRLLIGILAAQGYSVRPAPDGSLAIASAQAEPPDLILLDIMMPDLSGYEVCEQLKADERTRDIPVIFVSALDDVVDKVKGFEVGGVDYITKPIQVKEVLARVETHLKLRALRKELQTVNDELVRSNTELQARNEELDAYASTVAHDLRNPLNLMVGYAELLADAGNSISEEQIHTFSEEIVRAGHKMNSIIEELMLLAGLRTMQVEMKPLDMASVVAQARQRLTLVIKEYQGEITCPERWPTASGHAPWVEQVWVNYLSNAIKYGGRPPRIKVGATEQPDGTVRFWVRDNGLGIKPADQSRLFTPFERLDQARATGYGLGLSIVRRIVEKMAGQVGVESGGVPGQGSTFSFDLPSANQSPVAATHARQVG